MSRLAPLPFAVAALLFGTACHHTKPVVAPPAPGPNTDSLAAANARRAAQARAEAARRDSIARADAARRDSLARAEARRRAEDAAAAARKAIDARVFFDFDKDELRPDAIAVLDAKVPVLGSRPELQIRIEGNADDRGSDEYNLALAQRRAASVKRYLVARGIAASRLEVVSFGEEHPACHEEGESCWQRNRRDEFVITAGRVAATSQGGHPRS